MIITLIIVVIALFIVVQGIYYLIEKKKMKKWGRPVKIVFWYGFSLSSIIVIWEITATIIKHLR